MEREFGGRGFGNHGGDRMVPVREGDEMDVKIEAVGEKGDGLAKKDGFVLFVPNTKAGDNVRVRVTKVLRKVGFAEVIGKSDAAPSEEGSEESYDNNSSEESTTEEAEEETYSGDDSENFGEEDESSN